MNALDLFCGGGGTALGLLAAGFDSVVGVDSDARCAAVYPGVFVRADVQDAHVKTLLHSGIFDFVWASPPCQIYCNVARMRGKRRQEHPDLIDDTRMLLGLTSALAVIENVPTAPLRRDLVLSGATVGLPRLERRRVFELFGWHVDQPKVLKAAGSVAEGTLVTVTREGGIADRAIREKRRANGLNPNRFPRAERIEAMGLPSDTIMSESMIGNAVPPLYAEWIGRRAIQWIDAQRRADDARYWNPNRRV